MDTNQSSNSDLWKPILPGVSLLLLREDPVTGERALRLRLAPGARFPRHTHPAGEQLLVLSGEVTVGGVDLPTGAYLYTPPDAEHDVVTSGGCELFVSVPRPIRVLAV